MNWNEKIAIASEEVEKNESIEQDFFLNDSAISAESVSKLKSECPFITDDYIQFLLVTDGADIAQCSFFGSAESGLQDFVSGSEPYSSVYEKSTWFPIGHDAGGNPFLLHQSGRIALGNAKATSDEATFIADSFSEFLGEVIMAQTMELCTSLYRKMIHGWRS